MRKPSHRPVRKKHTECAALQNPSIWDTSQKTRAALKDTCRRAVASQHASIGGYSDNSVQADGRDKCVCGGERGRAARHRGRMGIIEQYNQAAANAMLVPKHIDKRMTKQRRKGVSTTDESGESSHQRLAKRKQEQGVYLQPDKKARQSDHRAGRVYLCFELSFNPKGRTMKEQYERGYIRRGTQDERCSKAVR